ncbi:Cytochrome C oxidase, cbb3-type, subunit III [Fulvimarina manganoxydans]|uniref:Cytochrome C oxidase, cbb3-type, subunit III n=1 Tax=Fulvimarina manganoxydans TaxID=937218 RepID=A0A1W2D1L1_9HYPH|nr:cytochrome c [Fulvimarina manganoxydans]SMC91419.1 Cytochrome C oxidase, cbb3-type, subunit III [Fulvimarina manganoxydans]
MIRHPALKTHAIAPDPAPGLRRALLLPLAIAALSSYPLLALAQDGGGETQSDSVERTAEPGASVEDQAAEAVGETPSPDGDIDPSALMRTPVTGVYPGDVEVSPTLNTPEETEAAIERGMTYFNQMNCVGCHAPNGAGGMGPSLSNAAFIYGREPANIYLTILQGRPAGMPAYGELLPDSVIWDLVAYVRAIAKDPPENAWGQTMSLDDMGPEQVPAEYLSTTDPWAHTQPFSYGQAPFADVERPVAVDEGSPSEQ